MYTISYHCILLVILRPTLQTKLVIIMKPIYFHYVKHTFAQKYLRFRQYNKSNKYMPKMQLKTKFRHTVLKASISSHPILNTVISLIVISVSHP